MTPEQKLIQAQAEYIQHLTKPEQEHSLLERYENIRKACLAYGGIHPESRVMCGGALKTAPKPSELVLNLATLLDDFARAEEPAFVALSRGMKV